MFKTKKAEKKIPKWEQEWNKLPLAKGQPRTDTVRRHPQPSYDPNLTNKMRMEMKKNARIYRQTGGL